MQQPENQPAQVARAETPQPTGSSWRTIHCYDLPPDLVEKAVNRLGWLALVYVASHIALRVVSHYSGHPEGIPEHSLFPAAFPLADIGLIVAVVSGLVVCALAWRRKLPDRLMLDIGLLFEVVGAFCIALVEFSMPPSSSNLLGQGNSSIVVWISFFILVVPSTFGKTTLAALTSAAMGPAGLAVSILFHQSTVPAPGLWLGLFFPNFWFAAGAMLLSRFIYRLGCDVSKAREMGSYKLLELIGSGGMGEVWRAQHRMLARASAIKMVRQEICGRSDKQAGTLHRRFEREVQATAALRSPHTVAVYDFGTSDEGCFYYVMELLDGLDLDSLVERFGPLPPERVISFLRQACDSLAEAHSNGLIHRDIKPKNIFSCRLGLNYDFIKVLDFGLVKDDMQSEEAQTRLTVEGTTTGTPAYMPPEMALGKTVDARTDIYALGCVGYWLLTGQLVFEGSTPMAMLLAHLQTPPIPPSERTEVEIPSSLEQVILSCLEKEPDRRPQSALELSRRLAACEVSETWSPERAERWWRTHMPSPEAPPQAALVAERET